MICERPHSTFSERVTVHAADQFTKRQQPERKTVRLLKWIGCDEESRMRPLLGAATRASIVFLAAVGFHPFSQISI